MSSNQEQNPKENNSRFLKYSGMGFQMIALMLLATWAGMSLDEYLELKTPWMTISLLLISVFGSMYILIKGVSGEQ